MSFTLCTMLSSTSASTSASPSTSVSARASSEQALEGREAEGGEKEVLLGRKLEEEDLFLFVVVVVVMLLLLFCVELMVRRCLRARR